MGRLKTWTEEHREDWEALRDTSAFKALELLATKGLPKAEPLDIRELVEQSSVLTTDSNLSAFRSEIGDAIDRVEPEGRRQALATLLRATPESEALMAEPAQKLARVYLGEAESWRPRIAGQLGKAESEVTPLEMLKGVKTGNDAFRRTPKKSHPPGERLRLLRDLYDQLTPNGAAVEAAVVDQPRGVVTYESGKGDAEELCKILKDQYNTDLELERFASLIIDDHRAIEHLRLDVKLRDDSKEAFLFEVNREFQARLDRYVVGVAAGNTPHRTMMRLIPELRELIWLPEDTDLDKAVLGLIDDGMLMIRDTAATTGYRPALFNDVGAEDPMTARVGAAGLDPKDYRLIEATIERPDELLHYRSSLGMQLRRERRRCTWFADGPTYVDNVRIDVSGLEDAANSSHVAVAYFLPGTEIVCGPQVFEREVHGWVVRHHGFTISW